MLHKVQKLFRNRHGKSCKNKMEDPAIAPTASEDSEVDSQKFPQFVELSDDICRTIISFIATAPHETPVPGPARYEYKPSSLTTTLPYVSKSFREMANSDSFWRDSLLRQLDNEAQVHHWKGGLRRFLPVDHDINEDTDILEEVQKYLGPRVTHKELYIKVFSRHIKLEAPIFMMPYGVELAEVYGLHLFEPRYRFMVRDLMEACQDPYTARRGGPILPGVDSDGMLQPPLLIHFCLHQRMRPGALACLVQVVWCRTYEHDTADVQLLPISWVRLDSVWVRPEYGHLFYGKATRL